MGTKDVFMYIEELGTLTMFDVLLSYIYPRVFVCEDEFDCKYLFYEMDSNETGDIWLVSKIKKRIYYDIIDRKIPIQSAYMKSQKRNLFVISKKYGEKDKIEFTTEYDKWIEYLPKREVYSESKVETNGTCETLIAARRAGRTIFDIKLFPGTDRHTLSTNVLETICGAFSSLTNSINNRRRAENLRIATVEGSCVVRFTFEDQIDLFNRSSVADEIETINSVLKSDLLNQNIGAVKNKKLFVQSYTKLMEIIKKASTDVQFTSAFPNSHGSDTINMSRECVLEKYNQIVSIYNEKTTEIDIDGKLVAIDIKKKTFKFTFLEKDSEELYSGSIADDLIATESYVIPGNYRAKIKISEILDQTDYTFKKKYQLLTLEQQ